MVIMPTKKNVYVHTPGRSATWQRVRFPCGLQFFLTKTKTMTTINIYTENFPAFVTLENGIKYDVVKKEYVKI